MLSVVIPTLNSAATLGRSLAAVAGADEIVVADGGSADATVPIAESAGAAAVRSAPGRGIQLRAGAEAARGDWLLFLHADTVPGPRWRAAAQAHIASAPEAAGTFRFRLDHPSARARVVERGVALRVALLGLPYGDQGLLISRALYDAVGGYRPLPLMEDVDLVRRIGRRRLRLLGEEAVTSADRWRRDGWALRSARNLGLLALYWLGVAPERLARRYR
jgi:rSAM/selenodomain-associated transferase 2